MADFYTILSSIGKSKLANAQVTGTTVNLTELAVGDGNGSYYEPSEDQTALKNEVWRGSINQIYVDSQNSNWVVIEAVIPTDVGGFYIREVGVFDDAGDMIAVGKYPETYKPALASGSGKDLYIRMILELSNVSDVTLKIDPAIVLASRGYVDESVNNHNWDPNAHNNAYIRKTGDTMTGELTIKTLPVLERLKRVPAFILGNEDWTPLVYYASNGMPVYSAVDRGVVVAGASNFIKLRMMLPVDPESTYFVRARIKKKSGDGSFYIGAISLDEDYRELSTDGALWYNYFGGREVPVAEGSVFYAEGTISGYNATTERFDNRFEPEAKFFNLVLICNRNATTTPTETVIEWLELYKAPNTAYVGPYKVWHAGNLNLDQVVPPGMIVMWSGSVDTIPEGWALCDGTNGTPNLRDRFIVGAGGRYGVGAGGYVNKVSASKELPFYVLAYIMKL